MDEALTPREEEVYNLLLKGFTRNEIKNILICSRSTVDTHVTKIFYKKIVNSQSQLLAKRIEELEKCLFNVQLKLQQNKINAALDEIARLNV